jgi:phosphate transport system substrate-binding protein
MKKTLITAVMIMATATLVFAGGSKDSAKTMGLTGTYSFGGSTTVAPIAEGVCEAMMSENPGLSIAYEGVGSSSGMKGVLSGTFSLGGASRDLKQSELDAGLVPVVIAKDGISVVVNGNVTVANLSLAQLSDIYTGKIKNWKAVGGADATIVVCNRDESSGTRGAFQEIVLGKNEYRKDAQICKENGDVAQTVASTPNAIGYVGLGFVETVINGGGKALMIEGVAPSVETVINGSYKVSRGLNVATKGPATGIEKAFIDYCLSPKGQAIVADAGFISLN